MITINLTHILIWILGSIIIYNLSPNDYKEEIGLIAQYIFQIIWILICVTLFNFYVFTVVITKI